MEDEDLQMGPNGGLIFCMEFVLLSIIYVLLNFHLRVIQ